MKVISTTDMSREGNDCYIHESVSLFEQFGIYIIIVCHKTTGWSEYEDVSIKHTTSDYAEAIKEYKWYGGEVKERRYILNEY